MHRMHNNVENVLFIMRSELHIENSTITNGLVAFLMTYTAYLSTPYLI